jgi:hypothetical protein
MKGIPFIGEDGFYPTWAVRDGRWVFQRTLTTLGGLMEGYAEMVAARTRGADQVIVWVPRLAMLRLLPGALHEEREAAIQQLSLIPLRCYGNDCAVEVTSVQDTRRYVVENGVPPERWRLECPVCHDVVGPDLESVVAHPIITQWRAIGQPALDNPIASAAFASATNIDDLPSWVAQNDPSHLELAYLGQQIWPGIRSMLEHLQAAT